MQIIDADDDRLVGTGIAQDTRYVGHLGLARRGPVAGCVCGDGLVPAGSAASVFRSQFGPCLQHLLHELPGSFKRTGSVRARCAQDRDPGDSQFQLTCGQGS